MLTTKEASKYIDVIFKSYIRILKHNGIAANVTEKWFNRLKHYFKKQNEFNTDVKRFLELYANTNECNEITYSYAITQLLNDELPKEAMKRLDNEYNYLQSKLKKDLNLLCP